MRNLRSVLLAATAAVCVHAHADTVKIAYIDPLSGPFANVGELGLKHFQYMADEINRRNLAGGVQLEIVPFDNKVSPQESLNALKQAIDRGIHYITQGNGSSVAGALIDAVQKNNERNPGQTVVFLNYAAVDPDFTNSKCSYWHFRFDANSDMKMEALTTYLAKDATIKNVYLINQNYSFGQAVARAAREYLGKKRPDIKIVGDDLVPLGQVRDFAPYVAKMKAAGTDTVITGNWGTDMTLLVKAAKDAGLNTNFYTYYAGGLGTPTAMGDSALGRVKQISEWHLNVPTKDTEALGTAFHDRTKLDWYYYRVGTLMYMLAEAMKESKSADPLAVAKALEGMKYQTDLGEVEMRAADHQLLNPLYVSTIERVADSHLKHDVEGTGFGFRTDARIEAAAAALPTSCQMKRP